MELLIINIAACFLVAHFVGSKRKIGFGWSLFLCIFLTALIGGIITAFSPRITDHNNL